MISTLEFNDMRQLDNQQRLRRRICVGLDLGVQIPMYEL